MNRVFRFPYWPIAMGGVWLWLASIIQTDEFIVSVAIGFVLLSVIVKRISINDNFLTIYSFWGLARKRINLSSVLCTSLKEDLYGVEVLVILYRGGRVSLYQGCCSRWDALKDEVLGIGRQG